MSIKGIIHRLKEDNKLFLDNPDVDKSFKDLIDKLTKVHNECKTINNQEQCLYIIETSDSFVRVGVAGNPFRKLREFISNKGLIVTKYYVTNLMINCERKERNLLKEFKDFHMIDGSLSAPFENVVSRFEELNGSNLKNQDFQLTYRFFRGYKKPVWGSDGKQYKSIASFAKAFQVTHETALEALNSGMPIKGIKVRPMKELIPLPPLKKEEYKPKIIIRKRFLLEEPME
jgi:hypothetical protein